MALNGLMCADVPLSNYTHLLTHTRNERRVPELISVLGSQPAGEPGNRELGGE